ncbi:MAG: hypothetical protein IKU52_00505 [Clostridia bacterium]|nr:hypothetical protein [Clostridia bacterium]
MKRVLAFGILLCLLISICQISLCANTLPDLTREAEITVYFRYGNKSIGGGEIQLYQVAKAEIENEILSYQLCSDFENSKLDLTKKTEELINDIGAYITQNSCKYINKEIDKEGITVFDKLEPGFYFLVQTKTERGYNPAAPFIIELPIKDENGVYSYKGTVNAKVSIDSKETETTPETKPQGENKLPQTGQLKWPVPILCASGLTMIAIGAILCIGNKKQGNEK